MRKIALALVAFALVMAACSNKAEPGGSSATPTSGGSPSVAATAADCAQSATFLSSGTLTIGTSEPAYPPYFGGGKPKGSDWTINDPNTGKGFESAAAYEVAKRLGFTSDQVTWAMVKFAQSYAPGTKPFDFDINEISYKPQRAQAVDFSESYYDVNQALVVVKGTPIASATSIADLKSYTLAAPLGTTSYDLITDVIKPDSEPGVYQTQSDAVAAINAGQVDGLVVDLPTALYMADPYVQQAKNSTVLGQFENAAGSTPEYFGMVFAKGSSLTSCVNLALAEMKADGTLQDITKEWLSDKTNVGEVPVLSP
jgi:polar amino acid transport system substrate-binding protein